MTEKRCQDCRGHFQERTPDGGMTRCMLDGSECWVYDYCENHYTIWKIECIKEDLEKAIRYIERLLKEVEKDG